ncbi:MAG: methyltransferase domain-containing protein, partial [Candidatus Brocadiales bacterium]|nr:methyltransferase domain-containing protein [Candidatus Bathyanammoxibius amoris]
MLRKNPCLTYRGQKVPAKGHDIDWNEVASKYHSYILGPFAKEMVCKDKKIGKIRNELLNYLSSIPDEKLKGMEIADFGCGPGNIIEHLKGRVSRLTGIDKSGAALKIASTSARKNGIVFTACRNDLKKVKLNRQFDLIISVNSILPKERKDVVPILEGIREHLKSDGELLAILPSYDTTKYLRKLLKKYYVSFYKDKRQAEETLRTFAKMKKVDDTKCAYADDGKIQQCYHTPKTIKHEFKKAGLKIIGEPKKVYYPWDLTRKFDYGYFPEAKEEIWDWFVVAKRAEKS